MPQKKNVAIIGGGTSLTTAWALDQQPGFKVTVFEQADKFGGHVQSFKVGDAVLEGGAEFIGNPNIYPTVHKLFKHLNVKLDPFELNIDFHTLSNDKHIVLPPVYHANDPEEDAPLSCLCCFSLFRKNKPQKDMRVSLSTLYSEFCNLLSMNEIINKAKNKVLNPEKLLTLEEFVNAYIDEDPSTKKHRQDFANQILYPLIAAGWGVSMDIIKTFGAHYAMNYLTGDENWYEATEGLSTYIAKLIAESPNTTFVNNCPIKRIVPIEDNKQTKYHLLKNDDTYCTDEAGHPHVFDQVVISSPAFITTNLISDVKNKDVQDLKDKLAKVQYYNTTVVFHKDRSYATANDTVVHTRFDGEQAANTMCKGWKFKPGEKLIMKTWVLPGQPMPKDIVTQAHYQHPIMNKDYYEAQQALHLAQGIGGLWWGGIMAGFNDSHESGITAALHVAAMACQQEHSLEDNQRLALFPEILQSIQQNSVGMAIGL